MMKIDFKKKFFNRLFNDSGVVMLEFAFTLPLFLIMICGYVEVPRSFVRYNRAFNAARIAADIQSRNPSELVKKTEVKTFLGGKDELLIERSNPKNLEYSKILTNELIRIVASIATFNEYTRLFTNVLKEDYLVAGVATWQSKSIYPLGYINFAIGENGTRSKDYFILKSPICYMPNRSGYAKTSAKNQASYSDLIEKEIKKKTKK